MNTIIVPVDMSRNSKEALRYAAHLAAYADATIMIVHCYSLLQKVVSHTKGKAEKQIDPEKWITKRIHKLSNLRG
jgi:nucleotide-binding universal stress UspA family protein